MSADAIETLSSKTTARWTAPTMTTLSIRETASGSGNSADAFVPNRPGYNNPALEAPGAETTKPAREKASSTPKHPKAKGWSAPTASSFPINGLE